MFSRGMRPYLGKRTITICVALLLRALGKFTAQSIAAGPIGSLTAPAPIKGGSEKLRQLNGISKPLLNSFWVLLFPSLLLTSSCSSGTASSSTTPPSSRTISYYASENIGNIAGRAFADGEAPIHLLNMSTFGETSYAVSKIISGWNMGEFTGVESPAPVGNYQLGIDNAAYGSSAVQMSGSAVGAIVNTLTIPGGSGYNNDLANAQVQYRWLASDNLRPWAHTTSKFNFSFNLQIPKSHFTGGAVGYVLASFLVTDGNGHSLWIQPQVYDVRGVNSNGIHEFVGYDEGTAAVFVNTMYGPGTRYCTQSSGSSSSTGSTWSGWRLYSESIDQKQLLNAVNDANSQYQAGLSTNPPNYILMLISIQDEIAWPTGNGWLPFSAERISAYETY
jgi:hypothetical protein